MVRANLTHDIVMKKTRVIFCVIALTFSLCACGQRGPLYLPQSEPDTNQTPEELPDSDEQGNRS